MKLEQKHHQGLFFAVCFAQKRNVLFVNCLAYTTKRFDDNIETSIQYK